MLNRVADPPGQIRLRDRVCRLNVKYDGNGVEQFIKHIKVRLNNVAGNVLNIQCDAKEQMQSLQYLLCELCSVLDIVPALRLRKTNTGLVFDGVPPPAAHPVGAFNVSSRLGS